MRRGRVRLLIAAVWFGGFSPVVAQEVAATVAPSAACCRIPEGTNIELEIIDPQGSKTSQIGAMFAIRLAEPVIIDGRTLITTGALGQGQVVHAAKARMMGKAGELILAARFIEADGIKLPLRTFNFGSGRGTDRAGTALAVTALVGVVGVLVTGGDIVIPTGTRAHAKTSAEVTVGEQAAPAPLPIQSNQQQGEQK